MKAKNQRLTLVVVALVAVAGAVLLAMWGLRDRASYFYTPSDIAAGKAAGQGDRMVRLGGMVVKSSLARAADGVTVAFRVTDGPATVPVTFRGILPSLFREGSGVVAEGRMTGTTFTADNILAKHDERYLPPQLGNQSAEHGAGKTLVK